MAASAAPTTPAFSSLSSDAAATLVDSRGSLAGSAAPPAVKLLEREEGDEELERASTSTECWQRQGQLVRSTRHSSCASSGLLLLGRPEEEEVLIA